MRILLTGASGMVGRNVLESEITEHHEVIGISSRQADLRDYSQILDIVSDLRPDLIVHAAGRVGGIAANMSDPLSFFVENWDLGRNVLMAAVAAKIPRVLNLGSSCMYPREAKNPLVEASILSGPLEPTNEGYALAKVSIAKMCEYISQTYSFAHYKTLIPCNLYGRYDKFDLARAHLIPAIIAKLHAAKLENSKTVEIWGDGTARREFMYAGDFCRYVRLAVDNFDDLPDLVNIGVGQDYSVMDYYRVAAQALNHECEFTFDLGKPRGMESKCVDVSWITNAGWYFPSDLADGIQRIYDYYLTTLTR